ncbi:TetR/AcrR family transcriptional regulator [Pigmentiphaga soli]|uniref:TetR/AcrR family transcriptional regulator n=2 Tax=Pigmentiphaga soli TaxID=1007095 RepID=A0ABP8HAZ7_9BURK
MLMRDRIKAVTTEILIRDGYQGLRFHQISERLGITRGNVHYHFNNKQELIEIVTVEYVENVIDRFRVIWTDDSTTLKQKIEALLAFHRSRYDTFNPPGTSGHSWSLISVLRADRHLLGDKARNALEQFARSLEKYILTGVGMEVTAGRLRADAPVQEIMLQFVAIANSAGALTQDTGSFDKLADLYLGFYRIVEHAYGVAKKKEKKAGAD